MIQDSLRYGGVEVGQIPSEKNKYKARSGASVPFRGTGPGQGRQIEEVFDLGKLLLHQNSHGLVNVFLFGLSVLIHTAWLMRNTTTFLTTTYF